LGNLSIQRLEKCIETRLTARVIAAELISISRNLAAYVEKTPVPSNVITNAILEPAQSLFDDFACVRSLGGINYAGYFFIPINPGFTRYCESLLRSDERMARWQGDMHVLTFPKAP
jgi:hypothetical protein